MASLLFLITLLEFPKIRRKKIITLETKLDILRRFDKGRKAVRKAKTVGLAATTIRSIRDRDGIREFKMRESSNLATSLDASTMIRTRIKWILAFYLH